jgi:uncharacterized protein (TIGR02284 family)
MANSSTTLRNVNVEDTLRSVIVSLIDDQRFFQKLGETVKDDLLKKYFLAVSLKCAQFRGDLETALHQEGMHDIVEAGSVSGVIYHMWAELQAKLHEGDHALLVTAEQAGGDTARAYRDALDKELPLPVRQLLSSQAAYIEGSHDYVKAARDSGTYLPPE